MLVIIHMELAVITEWDEFKNYDWKILHKNVMKPAYIFDGRNILDKKNVDKFKLISIGETISKKLHFITGNYRTRWSISF